MVASIILPEHNTVQALPITIASLASSLVGVGRQSDIIDNVNIGQLIHIDVKVTVGVTPVLNSTISVYLIKSNGFTPVFRTDGAGASDAALTVVNAKLMVPIAVTATTSNLPYYGSFLLRNPGREWGIAIVQDTGAALNATPGNHFVHYYPENQESQ